MTIRTKWHHLIEAVTANEVYLTAPPEGMASSIDNHGGEISILLAFLKQLSELPKFVVDPELVSLIQRDESSHSMLDMKRAGVLRLPYPALILERPSSFGPHHDIVLLRDLYHKERMPWEDEQVMHWAADFYALVMSVERDNDGDYAVVSPCIVSMSLETKDGEPMLAFSGQTFCLFDSSKLGDLVQQTYKKTAGNAFYAAASAYLLMATAGVDKEVVETARLNKKREQSNKPPIPRHVYIKIGRVYRSARSNESDEYIPRRSPIPHWRRGHLKSVRYGPGRDKIRERYIQPKLVAYSGDITPTPEPTLPEYVVGRNRAE